MRNIASGIYFYLIWIILIITASGCAEMISREDKISTVIDWQAYLSRHDLVWKQELPRKWTDGPFMGNGLLGTIIYVTPDGKSICFELGNSGVQDHRKGTYQMQAGYSQDRMPVGKFYLRTVGKVITGNMRLHLRNAVTLAHIKTDKGELKFSCYVHSDKHMVVTEWEASGDEKAAVWEFVPDEAVSPKQTFGLIEKEPRFTLKDYVPNPPFQLHPDAEIPYCYQEYLEGGETATVWKEINEPEKNYFIFSCAHSYPEKNALDLARSQLMEASNKGMQDLQKKHLDWWHAFYEKSFVSIPDAKLESFYWIQMYKLGSATRADRPIIDDSGPWHQVNPWAYLTWDLNVEMSYWPIYASNRPDLGLSLVNGLYNKRENLRNNLDPEYRQDSYALPINSGAELIGPVGVPDNGGFRGLVSSLPWTTHNLWLQYRHTMDEELLRKKIFPLMRGAIAYYFHFLEKGDDGLYHLPMTNSPEFANTRDSNMDLGLIRWGCAALLESCERLGIDDPMIPQWKDVLENLAPYTTHDNRMGIGPDATLFKSHRHFSHLLPVYPLYLINAEQEGGKEFIRKSVEFWLSRTEPEGQYSYAGKQSKTSRFHGYTFTAASSMYAAIGDGNTALEYIDKAFESFPHCFVSNGLYLEYGIRFVNPEGTLRSYGRMGPTVETALCIAQNIHDMLMQSWGRKIRIFPAVPDKWQDVTFSDLSAEGGFLVSAKRLGGETVYVRIKSTAGEPLVLRPGINGKIHFHSKAKVKIKETAAGEYLIDLKKGESIELSDGEKTDRNLEPVRTFGPANYWGEQAMQREVSYITNY